MLRYGDNLVGEFSLDIQNQAEAGTAGDLVTYCLFPEGESADMRHWQVLSLPAGDTQHHSIRYHLQDGQTYTLMVRCPWTVQQEYSFTVRVEEATDAIEEMRSGENEKMRNGIGDIFDLSGRKVSAFSSCSVLPKGIYVKHGKKILIP